MNIVQSEEERMKKNEELFYADLERTTSPFSLNHDIDLSKVMDVAVVSLTIPPGQTRSSIRGEIKRLTGEGWQVYRVTETFVYLAEMRP